MMTLHYCPVIRQTNQLHAERRDENALFAAGLTVYVYDKCTLRGPADVGVVFANPIIGTVGYMGVTVIQESNPKA